MRRREHERIVHELQRSHEREVASYREMLDRAMFMAGQQWTPPPLVDGPEPEAAEEYDFAPEQSMFAEPDPVAEYATE